MYYQLLGRVINPLEHYGILFTPKLNYTKYLASSVGHGQKKLTRFSRKKRVERSFSKLSGQNWHNSKKSGHDQKIRTNQKKFEKSGQVGPRMLFSSTSCLRIVAIRADRPLYGYGSRLCQTSKLNNLSRHTTNIIVDRNRQIKIVHLSLALKHPCFMDRRQSPLAFPSCCVIAL